MKPFFMSFIGSTAFMLQDKRAERLEKSISGFSGKTKVKLFLMSLIASTAFTLQDKLSWTPLTSNVTATLRGISAVSSTVVWASGSGNTILRSTDAGATWQRTAAGPSADKLDFRDIDAIDERIAYVLSIGDGSLSRIFKTTDGGATWVTQFVNEDPKAFFDAMAFWDANRGIAVSDSVEGQFVIILTGDGGRTWARVPADRLPAALTNEGAFAASGTNVAVHGRDHVWFATGAAARARVLRSADGGRTWQIAETPLAAGPTAGAYSIAFRDPLHGVVVGGDYSKEREAVDNLAITSDGGATWTLIKERGLSGFRSVVRHVPGTASNWLAVGPQGADWSNDDGRTWTPIAGTGFHTFAFAPDGKIGWGAGGRGTIGRLAGF